MTKQNDILTRVDRHDGLTVPQGYFDDFEAKMAAALPYRAEAEEESPTAVPHPGLWIRVRPYVYMAAMFAGVWCMLKMFTLIYAPYDPAATIERNPVLAEALASDDFVNDYILDDLSQWDIIDDMIDDEIDCEDLSMPLTYEADNQFIDPANNIKD